MVKDGCCTVFGTTARSHIFASYACPKDSICGTVSRRALSSTTFFIFFLDVRQERLRTPSPHEVITSHCANCKKPRVLLCERLPGMPCQWPPHDPMLGHMCNMTHPTLANHHGKPYDMERSSGRQYCLRHHAGSVICRSSNQETCVVCAKASPRGATKTPCTTEDIYRWYQPVPVHAFNGRAVKITAG